MGCQHQKETRQKSSGYPYIPDLLTIAYLETHVNSQYLDKMTVRMVGTEGRPNI